MTWVNSLMARHIAEECRQVALRHFPNHTPFQTEPTASISVDGSGRVIVSVAMTLEPVPADKDAAP